MAYLTEESRWTPNIYRIERADPILGGEFGINNIQARQLANRTQYLLWFLSSYHSCGDDEQTGKHYLKAADIASTSRIPESRFDLSVGTADLHLSYEENKAAYERILETIDKLSSNDANQVEALYKALILFWNYGGAGLDFCLFTPEYSFLPDTEEYHVYKSVNGDDSIDVAGLAESALAEGEDYILSYDDIRRDPVLVTVSNILDVDRVLLSEKADTTSRQARLSKSTWVVTGGAAQAASGDMMLTRVFTVLNDFSYGMLDIAHAEADDRFTVKYRVVDEDGKGPWQDAEVYAEAAPMGDEFLSSWRFHANAPVQLLITAQNTCVVDFMAVYPDPASREAEFVRTPILASPVNGAELPVSGVSFIVERFGALYKDPFASLEIVIDDDPDFSEGDADDTATPAVTITLTEGVDLVSPWVNITSKMLAAYPLAPGRTYYWKARYHAQSGKSSMWSEVSQFTTEAEG